MSGSALQLKYPYVVDEYGVEDRMLGDNIFKGTPTVIDVDHHEIHCGDSYMSTRVVDLGNGAVDTLIIIVPNETGTYGVDQKNYHTIVNIKTEFEADFKIYEGATAAADGTQIPCINRDRNSILTSGLGIYHTPTTPAGGTLIYESHWGGGQGQGTGGEARGQHEIILKNNTKYRLVLTNGSSNSNHIGWEINHYIHPGI